MTCSRISELLSKSGQASKTVCACLFRSNFGHFKDSTFSRSIQTNMIKIISIYNNNEQWSIHLQGGAYINHSFAFPIRNDGMFASSKSFPNIHFRIRILSIQNSMKLINVSLPTNILFVSNVASWMTCSNTVLDENME